MTTEVQQEEQTQTKFFDTEFSLFGKYAYTEKVNDISVIEQTAINTSKANIIVPHTSGRYQVKRFRKAQCPIIERLTNSLMYHGRNNGKKCLAIKIVKQTMDIIALITNKNPIRVVLDAIAVAGPREDSTRIGSGGAVKKTAVDVSPLRRINIGIYLITCGAREASFRTNKNIVCSYKYKCIGIGTENRYFATEPKCKIKERNIYNCRFGSDCKGNWLNF